MNLELMLTERGWQIVGDDQWFNIWRDWLILPFGNSVTFEQAVDIENGFSAGYPDAKQGPWIAHKRQQIREGCKDGTE